MGGGFEAVQLAPVVCDPDRRQATSGQGTVVVATAVAEPVSAHVEAHAGNDEQPRCDHVERLGHRDREAPRTQFGVVVPTAEFERAVGADARQRQPAATVQPMCVARCEVRLVANRPVHAEHVDGVVRGCAEQLDETPCDRRIGVRSKLRTVFAAPSNQSVARMSSSNFVDDAHDMLGRGARGTERNVGAVGKAAMKHRIALAAIVGLIGLSVLLPAEAQKRRPETPAATAVVPSVDDAFVAAHEAFTKNDPVRFEAAAAHAQAHPLAVYLEYWRLRLRLQAPNPDAYSGAADADVLAFLQRHPGTLVADLLSRDWMLNLGRRGEWALFDAQYENWILRDDDEAHCYASLGRVQRGLPAPKARPTLFSVRTFSEGCAALLDAQVRTGAFTRADLVDRLLVALETNSPDAVRRVAEQLALEARAVDLALSRPSKALARKPEREIALIALSRLARSDPAKAIETLPALGKRLRPADRAFVRSQAAASAMRELDPRALEWTRASLDAPATDATWVWLARAALREHDWKTLRAVVARMSEAGQRDAAWIYWIARAEREAGHPEKADAMLGPIAGQFTFYGQLAAEDLGTLTAPPPSALAATDEELAEASSNPGFERALRFYALGLRFEGNREWNFQLRGMSDRQLLAAARWACSQQVLDRCVNTADRTREQHDFALRFISPFLDQMKPVAASADLDPAWIYGLIRQESRFIMDARSWAGAQGLMQIMPATARWIAKKLGERDFRVESLHDLDTNLRFGTFYLRTVLDDLEGSPLLASAAYNAGPRRSRNWRSALSGPVEGAIFAEIIPFNETRDYVKKVLTNAVYYAALFSGQPQSLKARLGLVSPRPEAGTDVP